MRPPIDYEKDREKQSQVKAQLTERYPGIPSMKSARILPASLTIILYDCEGLHALAELERKTEEIRRYDATRAIEFVLQFNDTPWKVILHKELYEEFIRKYVDVGKKKSDVHIRRKRGLWR